MSITNQVDLTYRSLVDLTLGDQTYYLSDSWMPEVYQGNTYLSLGSMLSVSGVVSQISTSQTEATVNIAGISPDANFNRIAQQTPIRGGEITIYRLVDQGPLSDQPLTQAWISFSGIINTYAITETYEALLGEQTLQLIINAQSVQDFYYSQLRGEITNGSDRRRLFPGDDAFDNVSNSFGVL